MTDATTASASQMTVARRAARRLLISAAIFSGFVNVLMLAGPLYMLQIYDRVLSSRSYDTLTVLTLLTFGLFAAMAVLDFTRGALLARAGEAFDDGLKGLVFDLTVDAGRAGSAKAEQPLRDLRQIRFFVGSPALTAVFDAPWAPFFLVVVFFMHWLLGVVASVGMVLLLILALLNERISRPRSLSSQGMAQAAEQLASATIKNAAVADAMGMRQPLKNRWLAINQQANNDGLTSTDRIGGLGATSKACRLFLQSAILGTGAYLAIKGVVTPGVMIAAAIITGRALAPIEIMTGQWRNFVLTRAAYQRLRAFVGQSKAPPERTPLPAPSGVLAIDRLYCRPGTAKQPVLQAVSFEIAAGEVLGIIGPSAAGKSTLARALVGVEAAVSGDVRLDGARLEHWDPAALGRHVGYLPQDVELFAGTASENISRFSDEADPAAVIAAAQAAGVHEMVCQFEDAYETEIGEHGRHISAGQRQRLGLARALFGDPVLVVLDEPNSNLDAAGDAALARALQGLKARRATTVMIAHRLGALEFVDKLLVLADGRVRAFGPRDVVLEEIAPKQIGSLSRRAASAGASVNENEGLLGEQAGGSGSD